MSVASIVDEVAPDEVYNLAAQSFVRRRGGSRC